MDNEKATADRGRDDAADHAPKPIPSEPDPTARENSDGGRQDGSNYESLTDNGRAIRNENINSANDE